MVSIRKIIGSVVVLGMMYSIGNCSGKKSERANNENEFYKMSLTTEGRPYLLDKAKQDTFFINNFNGKPIVRDLGYNLNIIQEAVGKDSKYQTQNLKINTEQKPGMVDGLVQKMNNFYQNVKR